MPKKRISPGVELLLTLLGIVCVVLCLAFLYKICVNSFMDLGDPSRRLIKATDSYQPSKDGVCVPPNPLYEMYIGQDKASLSQYIQKLDQLDKKLQIEKEIIEHLQSGAASYSAGLQDINAEIDKYNEMLATRQRTLEQYDKLTDGLRLKMTNYYTMLDKYDQCKRSIPGAYPAQTK